MSYSLNIKRSSTTALAAALLLASSGCKAREMGNLYSDQQSTKVDPTWLNAVKVCWPELTHNGLTDESLRHQISDPIHFRAAFAPYATYSDAEILLMVTRPVTAAPSPDTGLFTNSSTPIVSADQAAAGITPSINAPASTATETALCSIHSGTPVGFK